jgi:hypothetical protein
MTIALCMIARDEAETLPICLASAAPVIAHASIVNIGSADAVTRSGRSRGSERRERTQAVHLADERYAKRDRETGDPEQGQPGHLVNAGKRLARVRPSIVWKRRYQPRLRAAID